MDMQVIDPAASPDEKRLIASAYSQVLLDMKREKDISSYVASAGSGDTALVLPALANSAKEKIYWPKIRDSGGVKKFIQIACLRHPEDSPTGLSPLWSIAVLGIVNSIFGMQRAQESGTYVPADDKAFEEIVEGYPQVIKTIWEDRRLLGSSLGGPAVSPRVFVAMLLNKLAIREQMAPGPVAKEPLSVSVAIHIWWNATEMGDQGHCTQALAIVLREPTAQETVFFLSTAPGGSVDDKCRATWKRVLTIITEPSRPDITITWTFRLLRQLILVGSAPAPFITAGVMENAYTSLTSELAKSVSRPPQSLDEEDLRGFISAGEFYFGLFSKSIEQMYALLVVGLFEGDADWLYVACTVLHLLASSPLPTNCMMTWTMAVQRIMMYASGNATVVGWMREKWVKKGTEKKFTKLNAKLKKTSQSVTIWLEVWGKILQFMNQAP